MDNPIQTVTKTGGHSLLGIAVAVLIGMALYALVDALLARFTGKGIGQRIAALGTA